MKTITIISFALFSVVSSNAQTDVDAFRYSGNSITGTARFTAMSGAFGALGGDFSSLSYNPAGIGIYRTFEFTFTPSIYVGSTSTNFAGETNNVRKYNFNIGNIGLIYTRKISNDENSPGWKSWSFGLGYNRLLNFHNRSFYKGVNNSSSLLDNFSESANGTDPSNLDGFFEGLAYNTYLINPDANLNYSSVIPDGKEIQKRTDESRGSIGETVFTFGGNYSNRLFLGGTLGFKSLRYVDNSTYEEVDPDTAIPYFNRFKLQQDLTTRGVGFDLKVGMIYKVNDLVRLGFAVETPTWYSLHDEYKNSMSGTLDTGVTKTFTAESPDGAFDYDYTSPFKAMGSIALVFAQHGLLSADYQFSDYGESRFDASGAQFSDVNSLISQKYIETHTVRIGTEWLYDNFSFRGGVSMVTSPLNDLYKAGSSDFTKKGFSLGIGYREDDLFFDIGYARTQSNEFYQPYQLQTEAVPGVKSTVVSNNFTMTLGVKF
jgi:hypothetical protein